MLSTTRDIGVFAESDRILLRNWNPDTDAEAAFEIYGDPEVMRYVGDGRTHTSVEAQRDALRQRNATVAQLNDGSGFWAIADKHQQDLVGTVILKRLPDGNNQPTAEWEVGWHLKKSAWKNGYATEAAKLVVDYAFRQLNFAVIYAVVKPENAASIRVTQRLGMTPKGRTTRYYGAEVELFELKNPAHG